MSVALWISLIAAIITAILAVLAIGCFIALIVDFIGEKIAWRPKKDDSEISLGLVLNVYMDKLEEPKNEEQEFF